VRRSSAKREIDDICDNAEKGERQWNAVKGRTLMIQAESESESAALCGYGCRNGEADQDESPLLLLHLLLVATCPFQIYHGFVAPIASELICCTN